MFADDAACHPTEGCLFDATKCATCISGGTLGKVATGNLVETVKPEMKIVNEATVSACGDMDRHGNYIWEMSYDGSTYSTCVNRCQNDLLCDKVKWNPFLKWCSAMSNSAGTFPTGKIETYWKKYVGSKDKCTCTGNARYGAPGKWGPVLWSGGSPLKFGIDGNEWPGGDPAYGIAKECQCEIVGVPGIGCAKKVPTTRFACGQKCAEKDECKSFEWFQSSLQNHCILKDGAGTMDASCPRSHPYALIDSLGTYICYKNSNGKANPKPTTACVYQGKNPTPSNGVSQWATTGHAECSPPTSMYGGLKPTKSGSTKMCQCGVLEKNVQNMCLAWEDCGGAVCRYVSSRTSVFIYLFILLNAPSCILSC